MQIDFHHGVTYVVARLAGFNKEEASIIAYSQQQVDDATESEIIEFATGETYEPLCSAHKAFNIRNFDNISDSHVWKLFHFLPGNEVDDNFDSNLKFICRPNSILAQEMVNQCLRRRNEPNSLYRLGITMHVYADTWAHQGFSGIQDNHNRVTYIENDNKSIHQINKAKEFFENIFDTEICGLIDNVLPLGHGAALHFPDLPYLSWEYKTYNGKIISRDNCNLFLQAVECMYSALKSFKENNTSLSVYSLSDSQLQQFKKLFSEIGDEDCDIRHHKWLEVVRQGAFGFGEEEVNYIDNKVNTWSYDEFLESDWRKFQDALKSHYKYVTETLFPTYNV